MIQFSLILVIAVCAGCGVNSPYSDSSLEPLTHARFPLNKIPPEEAADILSQLDLSGVVQIADGNTIEVAAGADELRKAEVVIELVDVHESYAAMILAPLTAARIIPSNAEIAQALGDLDIGTFAEPPARNGRARAIIDIHKDHLVAVAPAKARGRLMALVEGKPDDSTSASPVMKGASFDGHTATGEYKESHESLPSATTGAHADDALPQASVHRTTRRIQVIRPAVHTDVPPNARERTAAGKGRGHPLHPDELIVKSQARPKPVTGPLRANDPAGPRPHFGGVNQDTVPVHESEGRMPVHLPNGDYTLRLDLPQQMEMVQLLDLVGEYLHLDYMYEPEKMRGQTVTLKLHGKLQGEMRVKDLYLLLESVLKFKGYAMTCHEGNLVTIVPAADAMQVNPELLDASNRTVEPGDMVVTGVFDLQHIQVSAASSLLQNMKLSLAVTPVEGSRTLIVTCYAHQIDRIERLLRVVDKPGAPKEFRYRQLQYTLAESLSRKVQEFVRQIGTVSITVGAISQSRPPVGTPAPGPGGSGADSVYLDADRRTNRLMMIGYTEQLAVVEEFVDVLDVAQQDLRILKVYGMQYVEAEEIRRKLQELEIIGGGARPRGVPAEAGKITGGDVVAGAITEAPVVVVLEASNSLVINATQEQHAQIEALLDHLDAEIRVETIPYEIYFLENQDPENLAQVLERIVHEVVQDAEGKVQKILRNTDDQIVIVPDKETFSLIVYASRKNQEWIKKLISTLDRRRPQVLIDVTLVEIRKTDDFMYDLNLITSFPDLIQTGGQTGSFVAGEGTVVDRLLEPGMRSQFADFQSNAGSATGFYADIHINALLQAMQKKNYGRVLAKPKVLVNDNEKGIIKTTDTTYVTKKSSIPVTSGTAGQQNTLIETAIEYEPYDAGITLEITPHISDGELLRLEINLTRSDFGVVTGQKPPDQTSSDINTIVTVPDESTIILGGMLRLNQTKGGSKIPLLGDIPILGGAFRGIANSDIQSKLYVFVKAEIIRPVDAPGEMDHDLERTSEQNRRAFESYEHEFQEYESWPGVTAKPMAPERALNAH